MIEIPEIFCDMDQCLSNFLRGSRKALGREFNDPCLGTDYEKWSAITKIPAFWINLEWMPGAHELWDRIKEKNTYILSAIPPPEQNPQCAEEKKIWCQRELNIDPNRVFTVQRSEKKNFALRNGKPNLLIDDHHRNVTEWLEAGGIAIWHHTVPETIKELEHFGL